MRSSGRGQQHHHHPQWSRLLLLLRLLLLIAVVRAEYLNSPEFIDRFDTNEPMRQGNGMTGSVDGRVFATTQSGNLWIFSPLQQEQDEEAEAAEPIVFTPTPWVDPATGNALVVSCVSSVVLKETLDQEVEYAVYVVLDLNPANRAVVQSRVLGVNAANGELLWEIILESSAAVGTPAVGQEYLYVVHNDVATNEGRLSLLQVTAPAFEADIVRTVPTTTGAPWGPPSVTAFPPDDGTWREVVVWGESTNNGRSTDGNLYLFKVGIDQEEQHLQILSMAPGSTIVAPTLGALNRANNGDYTWNIATGNYAGLVNVFTEQDWNPFLEGTQSIDDSMTPAWMSQATTFTSGQFPLGVAPVFSPGEALVFVAGAEGGLSALGLQRGRRQWQIATLVHTAQPIVFNDNTDQPVIYACDTAGTIRQIEASNRGDVIWQANYCEGSGLNTCARVFAGTWLSRNGNRFYVANENGSIFGARVGSFATPAPTVFAANAPTGVPTLAPTLPPTEAPIMPPGQTGAPSFGRTGAPTVIQEDDIGPGDDGATDGSNTDGGETDVDGADDGDDESEAKDSTDVDQGDDSTLAPTSSPQEPDPETDSATAAASDDSISNTLYIMLAVIIAALCLCVGAAAMIFKRRRTSKLREEMKIREEMAAVNRWKSNKKMYEDDIKAEENATMQELSSKTSSRSLSPDEESPVTMSEQTKKERNTPELSQVVPSSEEQKKDKRARSRSRSRNRGNQTAPSVLDAISENMDEETGSPATDDEGIEISVDGVEEDSSATGSRNLTVAYASEDAQEPPTNDIKVLQITTTTQPGKLLGEEETEKTVEDTKMSNQEARAAKAASVLQKALKPKSTTTEKESKKAATKESAATDSSVDKSISQQKGTGKSAEINLTGEVSKPPAKEKKSPPTQKKQFNLLEVSLETILGPISQTKSSDSKCVSKSTTFDDDKSDLMSNLTEEPGAIAPRNESEPPAVGPSPSDDDMTSFLSGLSGLSQATEEPGAIVKTASKRMNYLPNSPCSSDLISVDSSMYLDDNTTATPKPPSSPPDIDRPRTTPNGPKEVSNLVPKLAPPDGASVASRGSSFAPGLSVGENAQTPLKVPAMIPALSIASDETAKRSNSKERVGKNSSSKAKSGMVPPNQQRDSRSTNQQTENRFSKPVHIEGPVQTRGRTRAGLFSRQERVAAASSSNSTSSIPSSSTNMSHAEFSESASGETSTSSPEEMKIIGKVIDNSTTEAKSGKSKSTGKDKKSKSKSSKADDGSPWNSFLNQLAKAEEEFFNPTLPAKSAAPKVATGKPSTSKTKRQYGRKRSGKQSFPPPLPPPSHTDTYFKPKDDESQEA